MKNIFPAQEIEKRRPAMKKTSAAAARRTEFATAETTGTPVEQFCAAVRRIFWCVARLSELLNYGSASTCYGVSFGLDGLETRLHLGNRCMSLAA